MFMNSYNRIGNTRRLRKYNSDDLTIGQVSNGDRFINVLGVKEKKLTLRIVPIDTAIGHTTNGACIRNTDRTHLQTSEVSKK